MKLRVEDKFFIEDDDGNLILITSIDIDQNMIKNNWVEMKGTKFYVDYDSNSIDKSKLDVSVMISFNVETIEDLEV